MGARLAGNYVIKPGRVGFGMGCRNDLNPVAASENRTQRRTFSIYFRRHATVADIRMHRIGEIDRCGVFGSASILPCGVNT